MATPYFINAHIKNGTWHGHLTGAGQTEPRLRATHQGNELPGLQQSYNAEHDTWHVSLPIPTAMIADGIQTVVVSDVGGMTLASFTLVAGEPLAEDLRAEISLLRSELDILKKAFRKHCGES